MDRRNLGFLPIILIGVGLVCSVLCAGPFCVIYWNIVYHQQAAICEEDYDDIMAGSQATCTVGTYLTRSDCRHVERCMNMGGDENSCEEENPQWETHLLCYCSGIISIVGSESQYVAQFVAETSDLTRSGEEFCKSKMESGEAWPNIVILDDSNNYLSSCNVRSYRSGDDSFEGLHVIDETCRVTMTDDPIYPCPVDITSSGFPCVQTSSGRLLAGGIEVLGHMREECADQHRSSVIIPSVVGSLAFCCISIPMIGCIIQAWRD